MIVLDTTSKSLVISRGSAATTTEFDYTSTFVDVTTSTFVPSGSDGATSGTGNVTVVAAPAGSTQRNIKQVTVYNRDTVADNILVKLVNGVNTRILAKVNLQVGEMLQYSDAEGWTVLGGSGGIKIAAQPVLSVQAGVQTAYTNTLQFSDSNSMSFGLNTDNVLTANAARGLTMQMYESPLAEINGAPAQNGSQYLQVVNFPGYMTATRLDWMMLISVAGSNSGSLTYANAVYTRNGLMFSALSSTSQQISWNTGGASTDTNSHNGISNLRIWSVSVNNWAFSPGEYWFGRYVTFTGNAASLPQVSIAAQQYVLLYRVNGESAAYLENATGMAGPVSTQLSEMLTLLKMNDMDFESNAQRPTTIYFRMFGTF